MSADNTFANQQINPSDIPDAQERTLILDPDQSFAVSAPAGSGKTELLTQRVLKLLAYVEKPEEILAITFTRKAAREMQDRIVQALILAENEPVPDEPHRKITWTLARNALAQNDRLSWSLLENTHRLGIKTIDSLCMQLAQRLPLLTGLGTNTLVTEQPEKFYQQAIRRLLEYLESEGQISQDLQLLLSHLDNNTARIEALLTKILGNRDQWLRHVAGNQNELSGFKGYLESCLDTLISETLAKTKNRCQPFERELLDSLEFAATNLQQEKPDSALAQCVRLPELPGDTPEQRMLWHGIIELLITKGDQWRARLTRAEGFPPAPKGADKAVYVQAKSSCMALIQDLSGVPGLLDLLLECRSLPAPVYHQDQWLLLGALTRLLPNLVAELLVIFSEHGSVDYPQITGSAVAALGSDHCPSDLALLLDHKITHILIDEFQDTSSSQFALLERLTEGWQPDDGHSMFIVGDGMQSCYGFRDANVGLFLAARENGIGNAHMTPIDLKVNFRSHAGVVHWVNQTFKSAFPQDNDISRGAVTYSPSIAHKDIPGKTKAVRMMVCIDDSQRKQEAIQVVDIVRSIQVDYPEDNTAILVRNRNHLREIIPALQRAGISWQAVDIDPLIQRPVISDLFALTRALLNLADRVAWLAVLRAPWCGLNLTDLQHLAGNKQQVRSAGHCALWLSIIDPANRQQISAEGQKSLERLIRVIQQALKNRQRKSLRQWLEGTWLALGGPATTEPAEFTHVASFFELLEEHDLGGTIRDMPAFTEAADRLYAKPTADPDIKLQIMTIHRAKGLEFDHVIIPGLDRTGASDQHALLLWHERLTRQGIPQLLISPIAAKGADEDALYQYLKSEQAIKQKLENTRLIYVAATRAIRHLYMVASGRENEKTGELLSPSKNSLLFSIWQTVEDQVERVVLAEETGSASDHHTCSQVARLKPGWQLPDLPKSELLGQFRGHEYRASSMAKNIRPDLIDYDQAQIKRLYLLMLQRCQQHQGLIPTDDLDALIKASGIVEPEINTQQLLDMALRKTLSDTNGQWLLGLSPSSKSSYSHPCFNKRININQDNLVEEINIPLTFSSENTIWLIDFDLRNPQLNEMADQLNDVMRSYRDKLLNWTEAYSALEQKPIKAAIYFPVLARFEPCLD